MPDELSGSFSHELPGGGQEYPVLKERDKAPAFGVYDPENRFSGENSFEIEQVYYSWIDDNDTRLQSKLVDITGRDRIP